MLDKFHSDVCGSFSRASIANHIYYVIFVDDFSCKCKILFMQKKYLTFSKFCEFKTLIEKGIGRKVKALRGNNGVEYVFNEVKHFFALEGI